jgi:uncharacterized pyridoxamine 5'-phosphate oxidase family protein
MIINETGPKSKAGETEDLFMQEVYDFLKKCGTYFIATEDGDQPRVRPFGTANLFEGKLYLQTGKKKDVAKQIAANSKVEICALDGDKWLRVAATLVEDGRVEAQKSMLDAYPDLQKMYKAGDGNTQVFYLKDATAVFYSMSAAPKTVKF